MCMQKILGDEHGSRSTGVLLTFGAPPPQNFNERSVVLAVAHPWALFFLAVIVAVSAVTERAVTRPLQIFLPST